MMIGGIFIDILILSVFLAAVLVFILTVRRTFFILAQKPLTLPAYTVIVVDDKSCDIEIIVRDILSVTEKYRVKQRKVILLDNGASPEIRDVCMKLCRDYPILCFIEKYQLLGCIMK